MNHLDGQMETFKSKLEEGTKHPWIYLYLVLEAIVTEMRAKK